MQQGSTRFSVFLGGALLAGLGLADDSAASDEIVIQVRARYQDGAPLVGAEATVSDVRHRFYDLFGLGHAIPRASGVTDETGRYRATIDQIRGRYLYIRIPASACLHSVDARTVTRDELKGKSEFEVELIVPREDCPAGEER
jgi:hypothetical protein